VLLTALTACGHAPSATAPDVKVSVGDQTVQLQPTQYCRNDVGQRYETVPPIIGASPDTTITFTVPDQVAAQGWSVQVFDQQLKQKIGEVSVDKGTTTFNGITTSDVVPPAFYLVVVEDKSSACGGFSGAWPVGFLRAGSNTGTATGTATATPPPSG
jgi:hypothetical protein